MVRIERRQPPRAERREDEPYAVASAAAQCCDAGRLPEDAQALVEWLGDRSPEPNPGPNPERGAARCQ